MILNPPLTRNGVVFAATNATVYSGKSPNGAKANWGETKAAEPTGSHEKSQVAAV